MALTYSKYLHVGHRALISKGVYDGALDQDYELHIDPLLLKTCNIPEFKGAYEEFIAYFNRFVTLAPFVKKHDSSDRFYRQIVQGFCFPERANTGLGYSRDSTCGRGISGRLSQQLAETAIEIIEAGFKDPEIFALLPLFEDNIGADRISDMTIAILFTRFVQYTHRVTSELGIRAKGFPLNEKLYGLPEYNARPIIFIPMTLLTDLPRAYDFDDIERVCDYNRRLKNRIAKQIGLTWEEYSRMKKKEWKRLLLDNPQYLHGALDAYKSLIGVGYDFNEDRDNKYADARLNQVVEDYPLNLLSFVSAPERSIYSVTMAILEQFKSLVENNYMWKIFNRKGRTPDETDWQLFIYSIANTYLKASELDIDVTRENNPGVGELDFKFSRGAKGKTVVEIKRSSNENLLHGYVTQLPLYMRAESAEHGIFVIIREDNKSEDTIQSIFEKKNALSANGEYAPEVVVIDASPKASASVS